MPDTTRSAWAPWYYYVCVMAAANGVAQLLIGGLDPVVNALVSVVLNLVLLLTITAAWRAAHPRRADR